MKRIVSVLVGMVIALSPLGLPSSAGAAMGDIARFAGTYSPGFSGDGGPATEAQLDQPGGVAVDASGNVYIADRENNRIRMVAPGGTITTLVDGLQKPNDVAVDPAADILYIAEEVDPFVNRIQRVDLSASPAAPVVVAGGSSSGYAGDGGPASGAVFRQLAGLGVGPNGDLFIADKGNNRIRRIDVATSTISLVAGTGTAGGDNGDALTAATFASPKDVAVGPDGTVYVADEGTNTVRAISDGVVSVYAGNYAVAFSGDGGPATAASITSPDGIAVAPSGDVLISDTTNNRVRRVDAATGIITTVAGDGTCCAAGDGGPATAASVGAPLGLAVDGAGNIWIAAPGEHAVRVVEGASVPGPPVGLTATRQSPVALAWEPPGDDGGAPVIDYIVYRDGVEIARTASTSLTDADAPPSALVYTVAARNAAGIGEASDPVAVPAIPAVPDPGPDPSGPDPADPDPNDPVTTRRTATPARPVSGIATFTG